MDLRLTALTEELATVFDQAVGTKCSLGDITNIEKFSNYFGAVNLRYANGLERQLMVEGFCFYI